MSDISGRRQEGCTTPEVDLDHLSDTYRFRPLRSEGETRVRMAMAGIAPEATVLDAGGGTGAHAAVMRNDGFHPTVLDPSAAQRSKARERGLPVLGGVSQNMPFSGDSFDVVYFHLSLHYGDWSAALREAGRVVRIGGRVWIWTFTRTYLQNSYLGRWFPSVRRHDLMRFPETDEVIFHLKDAGLTNIEVGSRTERVQRTAAEWQEAFAAQFVSTLQMVEGGELKIGIDNHRRFHRDPEEMVHSDLEFQSISGTL